jgi:prepilin-type N-terminal cleavage/methylation domain-containing protein
MKRERRALPVHEAFVRVGSGERGREQGFMLLELMVTLLVVGVLMAIALPSFAGIRHRAYVAQLKVALRDAALMEESYETGQGVYTDDVQELVAEGLRVSDGVSITDVTAGWRSYCLEATHDQLPTDHPWKVAHFSKDAGAFQQGDCPGGGQGDDGDGGDGDGDDDGGDDDDEDGDDDEDD